MVKSVWIILIKSSIYNFSLLKCVNQMIMETSTEIFYSMIVAQCRCNVPFYWSWMWLINSNYDICGKESDLLKIHIITLTLWQDVNKLLNLWYWRSYLFLQSNSSQHWWNKEERHTLWGILNILMHTQHKISIYSINRNMVIGNPCWLWFSDVGGSGGKQYWN